MMMMMMMIMIMRKKLPFPWILQTPNSACFLPLQVFFFLLFCPFNTFHRSSRFFFLNSLKRVVLAPFYKV
jgi:hypothetical protein